MGQFLIVNNACSELMTSLFCGTFTGTFILVMSQIELQVARLNEVSSLIKLLY